MASITEPEGSISQLLKSLESNLSSRLDGISVELREVHGDSKRDFEELKSLYFCLDLKITEN